MPIQELLVAGEVSIVTGAAGRYATALFELAQTSDTLDAVSADLGRMLDLMTESPDFSRLVRSPVFSTEERSRALDAVLNRTGIGGLAGQFLRVVAANGRLFAIQDIVAAYRALLARAKGEAVAQVTVAEQPSAANLSAIQDELDAVTGKHVRIDLKIDPAIIGGVVVKLGSRMVDDSLRTKLNSMKHAMKEVG